MTSSLHRCRALTKIFSASAAITNCILPKWPALVALNDRYAVALTRRIEAAIGAPFGKNLILVARKD